MAIVARTFSLLQIHGPRSSSKDSFMTLSFPSNFYLESRFLDYNSEKNQNEFVGLNKGHILQMNSFVSQMRTKVRLRLSQY